MQIKKIYSGSWIPRTALHLKEFFYFLDSGKSQLKLDEQKLALLHAKLKVKKVELSTNKSGGVIIGKMDKFDFQFQDNGLAMVYKPVEDLNKDFDHLGDFTLNKLFQAFSFIYSLGAPIPKIFAVLRSILPFLITASDATEEEIVKLFQDYGDHFHEILKSKDLKIYFGEKIIIISGDKSDNLDLIRSLIFLNDCQNQFNKVLNLHRFIWEESHKIKSAPKIRYKNLSLTRDVLLELNNDVLFFRSRLAQINLLLKQEKEEIIDVKLDKTIKNYLEERFKSLTQTGDYMNHLWEMTENHVKSTFELITSLYEEHTQGLLNTLQFIFIIGVVTSLITMGSVYGFDLKIFDLAGRILLQGQSISFTFINLLQFGGAAFGGGILIYLIFHFIYNRLAHSHPSNAAKIQNKELDDIKKMLK